MTHVTVFDLAQYGFHPWAALSPFAVFLIVGLTATMRPPKIYRSISKAVGFAFVVWAVVVGSVMWKNSHDAYATLLDAYQEGRFSVVEGTVTDFLPMPPEGHRPERFTIKGRTFEYFDTNDQLGFHKTSLHGGPVRVGVHLRVSYVGNNIVKLEIIR